MTRLFFAVLPHAAVRATIEAVAATLPLEPPAHRVPTAQLHVTLAFVGEVPDARLPVVRAIGGALRAAPFVLRFDAFEYWPKPEVVVGAARLVPPALQQLWRTLHERLAEHDWARDAKRLRPHVTLAKNVARPPVLPTPAPFDWEAKEFSLLRSDGVGVRSSYTVVDTWQLLDEVAEPGENWAN